MLIVPGLRFSDRRCQGAPQDIDQIHIWPACPSCALPRFNQRTTPVDGEVDQPIGADRLAGGQGDPALLFRTRIRVSGN